METRSSVKGDAGGRDRPILVIALGGNAIARPEDEPSFGAQMERARATVELLMPVIASGAWRLVITHGNGPQVGHALLRSTLAAEADVLPEVPVDAAVAATQGDLGYMIQQCLGNALWESGIQIPVATIVTQVVVDEEDPAFADPAKPIGRFYDEASAAKLERRGWRMKEDPQGRGWRRVVPSPKPREIVEEPIVRELVSRGIIVITCGGGGVPVAVDAAGSLTGVEAVIDKDLASSLLAGDLGAGKLAILTDEDHVYTDYRGPDESAIDTIELDELTRLSKEGHFPPGSMGPKVDAVIRFLDRGAGRTAVITSAERLVDSLAGRAGTRVVARAGHPVP